MDETPLSFLVDKHVFSTGFSAILNYLRVYDTWSANSGYFFMHKPPMSHVSLEELGGPHQFLNGAFDAWACHCWDRLILRVVEGSKSNGQRVKNLILTFRPHIENDILRLGQTAFNNDFNENRLGTIQPSLKLK